MTPNERKALLFLAGIGLLGTAAQALTSSAHVPTRAERTALAGQLDAVDSARRTTKSHHARQPRKPSGSPAPSTRSRPIRVGGGTSEPTPPATVPSGPIDVDVADAATLETLPGVGPALAARIVADRSANGAFGSLDGLRQVRGIGPKLAERLAPHVTFSGVSRPSRASDARAQRRPVRR